jgi:hypothetical protein
MALLSLGGQQMGMTIKILDTHIYISCEPSQGVKKRSLFLSLEAIVVIFRLQRLSVWQNLLFRYSLPMRNRG